MTRPSARDWRTSGRLQGAVATVLASAPLLWGCTSTTGSATTTTPITAVAVDPTEFLGDVACTSAPGAMRAYVATLVDVSPATDSFDPKTLIMPSSAPVSCISEVQFQRITIGRQYVADIQ